MSIILTLAKRGVLREVERLVCVAARTEETIDALKDVVSDLEMRIEAMRNDLKRRQRAINGDEEETPYDHDGRNG